MWISFDIVALGAGEAKGDGEFIGSDMAARFAGISAMIRVLAFCA
jgi:hypothetical protein